jgi:hypothetical protein
VKAADQLRQHLGIGRGRAWRKNKAGNAAHRASSNLRGPYDAA